MKFYDIPSGLQTIISDKTTDFIIKTTRKKSLKTALMNLFWGIMLLFITVGIILALITSEGEDVASGILFLLIFSFLGIAILYDGLVNLFPKGMYFASTKDHLIQHTNKKTEMFHWSSFTENILTLGDNEKGSITLERIHDIANISTKKRKKKYESQVYIPVYIGEIEEMYEILRICKKRIEGADNEEKIEEDNIWD